MTDCSPTQKTPTIFPFEIQDVDEEVNKELMADFTGERTGFVQVGPEKWLFPAKFREHAANFYNFEVRPDDVWVVTFPRSGTTWTQELVWLVANDLDFDQARKVPQVQRFPFFEFNVFMHDEFKAECLALNRGDARKEAIIEAACQPGYEILNEMNGQRFIKSHFPFSLLPPKILDTCKVVYVARNPKDVAVSFYHLNRLFKTQGYLGDFNTYWNYFERNLQPWTPYWKHLQEGWERRHHPNLKFLFYEDMNKDLPSTIHEMAEFFGKSYDKEQVEQLADYLSIENLKNNPAVNMDVMKEVGIITNSDQGFIRKGKTGGWCEEFTPELSERADRWIEENLQNTDLRFP